jgi:hypothetical protein
MLQALKRLLQRMLLEKKIKKKTLMLSPAGVMQSSLASPGNSTRSSKELHTLLMSSFNVWKDHT